MMWKEYGSKEYECREGEEGKGGGYCCCFHNIIGREREREKGKRKCACE